LIKTNIPGRISFKVASKVDSRIILDESGAERLLANGDMLFHAPGVSRPERHHGAWLPEEEIDRVTRFWADQGEPDFDEKAVRAVESEGEADDFESPDGAAPESEERYDEILAYVAELKEVSASLLQRKFRLGYPRAARMIEIFEKEGVVGPANGSKPRQVLIYRGP
jgi:S-DNA-T family DNA segregation ATPase FtsK/SpoIIIE